MKRVALLMCMVIMLAGCGRQAAAPQGSLPDVPQAVQKEKVPLILDAGVPERDPFAAAAAAAVREKGEAAAVVNGRDPFAAAAASTDWQTARAAVSPGGRDPFAAGTAAELPPEPEVPAEEPGEPGEVPAAGAVVVQLETLDRCWLEVFVDGRRVLRTNVPVGETLTWAGTREVVLEQVGREQAVLLVVNGRNLGRLAEVVPRLERGPVTEGGVAISLERRYPGGVLVGLRFYIAN